MTVDLRYLGQSHELSVAYEHGDSVESLAARFHDLHHERNGFSRPDDPIEVVTVRAVATAEPSLGWSQIPELQAPLAAESVEERQVVANSGDVVIAAVVARDGLAPGDTVVGPAVIEDGESTTYLDPGDTATVASNGAVVIEW